MTIEKQKITEEDVFDAFPTEVVIATFAPRKLIYDLFAAEFELWINGESVWRGVSLKTAVHKFNEHAA